MAKRAHRPGGRSTLWMGWMLGALLGALVLTGPVARADTAEGNKTDTDSRIHPFSPAPAPTGFQHHTATVNGVSIHYVKGGVGPPLLLIHGWPQTWYMWNRIMPALAAQYTVIAPDLRGAGDSSKPATGYTKRQMASDLYQLVQTLGLGSQQISLVGHDIGSMVAYAYAADHPTTVRRLVVSESTVPGVEPEWSMATKVQEAWHIGFHVEGFTAEMLVAGRERGYIVSFYTKWAYNQQNTFTQAEVDEFDRAYSLTGAMAAGFKWYRTFSSDYIDNQSLSQTKLTMPVLAIGGDAASGLVIADQAQRYATNVTGAVIPQCGHWILQEQPTAFLQQITPFLQ